MNMMKFSRKCASVIVLGCSLPVGRRGDTDIFCFKQKFLLRLDVAVKKVSFQA